MRLVVPADARSFHCGVHAIAAVSYDIMTMLVASVASAAAAVEYVHTISFVDVLHRPVAFAVVRGI